MTDKIKNALETLELPARASMRQINNHYKKLIHKWHPDKCGGKKPDCHEKTVALIAAYKLLTEYCENYEIPFDEPEGETRDEFWARHFGSDPFWGNPGEKHHGK